MAGTICLNSISSISSLSLDNHGGSIHNITTLRSLSSYSTSSSPSPSFPSTSSSSFFHPVPSVKLFQRRNRQKSEESYSLKGVSSAVLQIPSSPRESFPSQTQTELTERAENHTANPNNAENSNTNGEVNSFSNNGEVDGFSNNGEVNSFNIDGQVDSFRNDRGVDSWNDSKTSEWETIEEFGNGDSSHSSKKASLTTSTLVLMRHGESMWNDMKLFTGDVDIPLTEKGVMEALAGGKAVAQTDFDMIFTSRLMRSKQTALLAMTQSARKSVPVIVRGGYYGKGKTGDENRIRLRTAAAQALKQAECHMIPVYADPSLNERCYGDLQGLNKEGAVREFGEELVQKWRRSHDTRPPHGESLEDTWNRSVGFFKSTVVPRLEEGNNVLLVAHGNVLRCIISYLSHLSYSEMLRLQVMTALPYAYSYSDKRFAACCVLPPVDPSTNQPLESTHRGLTSVLKKGQADSLI